MIDPTPYVPSVLLGWQRAAPDQRTWVEDGALAFLDVSGFTAMSERLGRLGREGAEIVTDVIGSTFDELLAVAYEAGGSLLKFGGDAMLLWFGGEGAVDGGRRACFTAARMRVALRGMGAIPTPVGAIRIRMSAGVHAGRFHFFVVGERGRELVVTGPGASRTVQMEAAASAGQVLASPETVELLGGRWFGHAAGPGVLVKLPPPIGDRVKPTLPDAAGVDVPMLLSTAVRRRLAEGADESEHRHAAVGFIKFGGLDSLIERRGPSVAAERLHELVSVVQAACDEHEVALVNTDVENDGGKFLLCAGAPLAVGDEDERMLRTLRAVVDSDTAIKVRAGAHRGLLFSGTIGPFYRRSYTLMGDVVNTAARVMSHAEFGQVLATREVVDRTRNRFAHRVLPAFSAKGKTSQLVPYEIGAPQAALDEPGTGDPIIGRELEQAALLGVLDAARDGSGAAVEVVGEAGIGKSRLVRELCAVAVEQGMAGVVVRGDLYDASTPYSPFRRMLRALLGLAADDVDAGRVRDGLVRLDPGLADATPFVAAALGVALDGDAGERANYDRQVWRNRLHAAVTRVIEAAAHRPVVLVAEDAQWLDEPSGDLLRHLAREARSAGRRWVVAAARRSDADAVLGRALTIEVGPLSDDDAERLVRRRMPFAPLPAQIAEIVRRGAGNPLFLEQLAETFDPDADEVPDKLEELVAARIDRLPAACRNWLRQLSVLGASFDFAEGGVVLDRPLLEAADLAGPLEEFLDVRTDGAAFRQHVFQSVAYAGLSFRRRRELHERVGLHAEERGAGAVDAAKLAKHFDVADRFDRSWPYAVRAGAQAFAQHAYGECLAMSRLALRAAPHVDPDPAVLRDTWARLGDGLKFMGRQPEAFGPYRKARALAEDDPVALAHMALRECDLRQRLGRLGAAVRWARRGLRLLEGVPEDEGNARWVALRLVMSLGKVRIDQGRFAEAASVLRQALARAEAAGDRPAIGHSSLWLAYALLPMSAEGCEALAERALAVYEDLGADHWAAAALNGLASAYKHESRWGDAVASYRRAAAKFVDLGDAMALAVVSYNMGELLILQGRFDDAEEKLTAALQTFEAAGHLYAAVAKASLGRAVAGRGDVGRGEELLADAVERLRAAGMHSFAREAAVSWAELRAYRGDADGAAELLDAHDPCGDDDAETAAARVRGVIAHLRGDDETARAELASSFAQARASGKDLNTALAVLVAERLGLGALAADFDRTDAELLLARLGVTSTPEPVVRQDTTIVRRELCTKQSS